MFYVIRNRPLRRLQVSNNRCHCFRRPQFIELEIKKRKKDFWGPLPHSSKPGASVFRCCVCVFFILGVHR